ncbi:MAG TPA: undecaprenyldiphospho-muramoylpentapeptide beta-N-acetylglucosaminyltransferase [Haliangium sp.]|nr:undecaprenyldiphospho-muramoylpentapeptide beta-N-acetylglucosaminyltransferase [Haliangium sp.]
MTSLRLLIAGGGTGGHLFPGVALAEEVRARDPQAAVRFVGTRRGIEARVLPELGWDHEFIEISGLKTVGLGGAVRGFLRIPRALWQSRRILRAFAPDVVIGVGGYASGPVVLAARLMGLPTAILEQNSIPGLTNKMLGRFVRAVFVSFDESRRFFPARSVVASGNPIRRSLLAALRAGQAPDAGPPAGPPAASDDGPKSSGAAAIGPAPAPAPAPGAGPCVLVFGGSQGARALNEMLPAAAALLRERGLAFRIVHQTGEPELEATRARYRDAGIPEPDGAECRAFIRDMAAAYQQADLVVSRAGATTVAELGVVGRPAILIPYPHAADNHQEINAQELVAAGAARLHRQAELTPGRLADSMAELLGDVAARDRMAAAMKKLGRPEAAATIADWCAAQARGPAA